MLLSVTCLIGVSQSCKLNEDKNSLTIGENSKLKTILIPQDADDVVILQLLS